MARKSNQQDLDRLITTIDSGKPQRIGALARLLGWSQEKVTRQLVTLNDQGFLYAENERKEIKRFDPFDESNW